MEGYDESKVLSSVEQLDGLSQVWKSVLSMQTPRCFFAAVSYVIEGLRSVFNALKSVEKYYCASDKWIYVNDIEIKISENSVCVMEGKIFVVGG